MKELPTKQKMRGGYYTPLEIASFITEWGFRAHKVSKVLEPSCGDGVFLGPITDHFEASNEDGTVLAIELDREEAGKAKSSYPANVINDDFFNVAGHLIEERDVDLALGNPPFIRYQNFDPIGRDRAFDLMRGLGLNPNKLTNIWVPFLVLSAASLKSNGRLGMVIPAEILQVNYAQECREFISRYFGKITIISFQELMFPHAQQEVVLILAERIEGIESAQIAFIELKNADELKDLRIEELPPKAYSPISTKDKWTKYLLPPEERKILEKAIDSGNARLTTEYFETNVGVVSGENSFFLLNKMEAEARNLIDSTTPIVSKTEQLEGIIFTKDDYRRKSDSHKKMLLFSVFEEDADTLTTPQLDYISEGEIRGVNDNYKCRIRHHWFVVPTSWKPTGFAIRQSGKYPRVVVNETGATSTDTVHKLRFKSTVDPYKVAAAFMNSLTFAQSEIVGRSYGGGVLTFEPSEIRKLLIPSNNWDSIDPVKVDELARQGDIEAVLDYTDEILLIKGMGLTHDEVEKLRRAWRRLSDRRMKRKLRARRAPK